jgi:hypothetical protein
MKLIEKGRLYIEPHEIVYFKTLVGKTEYESSSISRTSLEA